MTTSSGTKAHVVAPFLKELEQVKLNQSVALHEVHKRVLLAEMVLAEVEGDDLQELALRSLAEALIELCWWPTDMDIVEQYLAARQAHLDVVQAGYDSM